MGSLSACPAHRLLSIKDTKPGCFSIFRYNKSPLSEFKYIVILTLSRLLFQLTSLFLPVFSYQATPFLRFAFNPFWPHLSWWRKSVNSPQSTQAADTVCAVHVWSWVLVRDRNCGFICNDIHMTMCTKCHPTLSMMSFRILSCSNVPVLTIHPALCVPTSFFAVCFVWVLVSYCPPWRGPDDQEYFCLFVLCGLFPLPAAALQLNITVYIY